MDVLHSSGDNKETINSIIPDTICNVKDKTVPHYHQTGLRIIDKNLIYF